MLSLKNFHSEWPSTAVGEFYLLVKVAIVVIAMKIGIEV